MKKYILISILVFSTSFAVSAENLYHKDYDKFWDNFWASQKEFVSCKSAKITSTFIVNSFSYGGNAEVTQAYSEEIEKIAIKKPACLVEGLSLLNNKQLNEYYNRFIKQALFHSPNEIITSIKKNGKLQKFPKVQKLFK